MLFLETVSEAVKHPPDMCIVGWSLSHIVREIYSQLIQLVKYEWNSFSVYYCYLTSPTESQPVEISVGIFILVGLLIFYFYGSGNWSISLP